MRRQRIRSQNELLYVAATRAEHYLGVLVADGKVPSIIQESFSFPDSAINSGKLLIDINGSCE